MSTQQRHLARLRTRWSAIGAAVAVTLGGGGIGMANAAIDSGDRPVTVTIASERVLDTRTNLGLSGRFADATPRDLQITGSVPVASGGSKVVVPDDAIGVLVNVTVVTPSNDGFLSLRPSGATGEPTTSTVNFTPGSIEPNAATVDLNDGKIQIWVETSSDSGNADVLIDIVGYTIGHTHDDRYYTESESDAAVAAAVAPKANSADVYTKTEVDNRITDSNGVAWDTGASVVGLPLNVDTTLASLAIDVAQAGDVTINVGTSLLRSDSGVATSCKIKVDGVTVTSRISQMVGGGGTIASYVNFSDTAGASVTAGIHDIAFTCNPNGPMDAYTPTLTVTYSANDVG